MSQQDRLSSQNLSILAFCIRGIQYTPIDGGHIEGSLGNDLIQTVADLFAQIKEREHKARTGALSSNQRLAMSTMYQGLPRNVLEFAAFEGIDVRVVEGRIRKSDGIVSKRMDCMVVIGEPEVVVPPTAHCIYPIGQVIAVMEVKRNLFPSRLDDFVADPNYLTPIHSIPTAARERVRAGYFPLFDSVLPDSLDMLPDDIKKVYTDLVRDATLPLRVVLSYGAFPDENALRQGLIEYLANDSARESVGGNTPSDFADLVLCGDSALIKMNGQPYAPPQYEERGWHFYGSLQGYNAVFLLEMLWTRIQTQLGLEAEVQGADLKMPPINALLFARLRRSRNYLHAVIPREHQEITPKNHSLNLRAAVAV